MKVINKKEPHQLHKFAKEIPPGYVIRRRPFNSSEVMYLLIVSPTESGRVSTVNIETGIKGSIPESELVHIEDIFDEMRIGKENDC